MQNLSSFIKLMELIYQYNPDLISRKYICSLNKWHVETERISNCFQRICSCSVFFNVIWHLSYSLIPILTKLFLNRCVLQNLKVGSNLLQKRMKMGHASDDKTGYSLLVVCSYGCLSMMSHVVKCTLGHHNLAMFSIHT